MNSSIRLVSPARRSATSRNVSMCRSGMIRMCVSACGLMSLIATKPLVFATYVPSRTMSQKRQSSRGDGNDSLLGYGLGAGTDELAHPGLDQERRGGGAVGPA